MKKVQKAFKVLSWNHSLDILRYIYENQPVSFKELYDKFPLSSYGVRKLTNHMSQCGMIKSIQSDEIDRRKRAYITPDKENIEKLLSFEIS